MLNDSTFPSPYGDFVFQRLSNTEYWAPNYGCFRPLTGILFFNSRTVMKMRESQKRGFRPLTGILFFNLPVTFVVRVIRFTRFRPLTGILFFN